MVDADGVIIVGHTRWQAATKLGLEKVPVHIATDLSPDAIKAYRIADNRTGENAKRFTRTQSDQECKTRIEYLAILSHRQLLPAKTNKAMFWDSRRISLLGRRLISLV